MVLLQRNDHRAASSRESRLVAAHASLASISPEELYLHFTSIVQSSDDAIPGKDLESELRHHFSAIVESSDDAILSKNLDGIIQSWNQGAERIFGYTAAEIIGRARHRPHARRPAKTKSPTFFSASRKGERVDHYETIRQRKDGRLIAYFSFRFSH